VVCALLPLKDLAAAKSRLAGLLRPSERRALAQAMAEDVLGVLGGLPVIGRVILLSDDPCAPLLAERYGARWWPERDLPGADLPGGDLPGGDLPGGDLPGWGLNNLLEAAVSRLFAEEKVPVLVLHADLPLLQPADLVAALVAWRPGERVVGCDRHGTGTNLLLFDSASRPRFCFGPDSCRRHLAQGPGTARRLQRDGIALDVDEPADLALLLERLPSGADSHTARLLCDTALGARLAVALASLSGANPGPAEQGQAL